jgi:hypothetical protein
MALKQWQVATALLLQQASGVSWVSLQLARTAPSYITPHYVVLSFHTFAFVCTFSVLMVAAQKQLAGLTYLTSILLMSFYSLSLSLSNILFSWLFGM